MNLRGEHKYSQLSEERIFYCQSRELLCGARLLSFCFMASAMYSRSLMGFSNLATGLEIMKEDKGL